jgi:hypothetical protein
MTRPPARQLLSYLAPYGPHISNLTWGSLIPKMIASAQLGTKRAAICALCRHWFAEGQAPLNTLFGLPGFRVFDCNNHQSLRMFQGPHAGFHLTFSMS